MVKNKTRRRTLGSLSLLLNPGSFVAGSSQAKTPKEEVGKMKIVDDNNVDKNVVDENVQHQPVVDANNDAEKKKKIVRFADDTAASLSDVAVSLPTEIQIPSIKNKSSCSSPARKEVFLDAYREASAEERPLISQDKLPLMASGKILSRDAKVDAIVATALVSQVEQLQHENDTLRRQVELQKQQAAHSRVYHKAQTQLQSKAATEEGTKHGRMLLTLEATVQAQKTARATLEKHVGFLTKRYNNSRKDVAQLIANSPKNNSGNDSNNNSTSGVWWERCQMLSEDALAMQVRGHLAVVAESAAAEQLHAANSALGAALKRSEETRRALHEQAMSLRGNMRVYCRLRPNTTFNDNGGTCTSFEFEDGDSGGQCRKLRVLAAEELSADGCKTKNKAWCFEFDRVFRPDVLQLDVYSEVQGLVQSVLDGFNVCVFAYGQTGSGKTHTMFGSNNTAIHPEAGTGAEKAQEGIIPRALRDLTEAAAQADNKLSLSLSFLEIYNDQVYDLLEARKGKKQHPEDRVPLQIRNEKGSTTTFVENLSKVKVQGCEHAQSLVTQALAGRSVAKTRANDYSSRSHTVLTLNVYSAVTGKKSAVHLVDLAGSERLGHSGSGVKKKLFKEAVHINSSLAALKNALRCIAAKQAHVPFRDSKLTYLLQNALQSHSCKTLMICTISQKNDNLPESVNSLRFSENVFNPQV